jgi:predicted O-methyltransferase YrrM
MPGRGMPVRAPSWSRFILGPMGLHAYPVRARHSEVSILSSTDDAPGRPTRELLELALQAARGALDVDLSPFLSRSPNAARYLPLFPGEHYRLLASFVSCLQPKLVIEIGTFTGLSALAMLSTLPLGSRLITYDLLAWDAIRTTALRASDFAGGRLEQRIGNLADPAFFQTNSDQLLAADMVFLDGPKDGHFEAEFLSRLRSLDRPAATLVVLDDIRIWKMLAIWRELDAPKLDLTSFGHWTGTGLCLLSS